MPLSPTTPPPRDDIKERIREAVDIIDVVGSYIALRRQGKAMTGICPWHDDSRPSLQVNPDRQTYRCWVCDVGGDVFSFVMRMEKVEFREALEQLADRAGITLPRGRGGLPADDKATLRSVMAWAADRFRDCLRSAAEAVPARDYLLSRGLTHATIDRFQLGFAPPAWDWLLRQASGAGIGRDDLVKAGLVVEREDRSGHYDRFRGRIIFPIRDPQGRCVAFGGRVLPGDRPDSAKYINSPETPLFSKSSMLYGLDTAREAMTASRRAIVVEGYTDCLAARQAGVDDVVAVLGTALGERHVKLLRRYVDRIVLVLDGDDAGRRRANEVLEVLLAEPVDVRIARMPSGVDPCDLLVAQGRDAFESLVADACDPLDYRMDEVLASLAPDAGDDAALASVESVLKALAAAAGRSSLVATQQRLREDQVLGRLSRRFGLSRDLLRSRLLDLRGPTARAVAPAAEQGTRHPGRLPAWDREVLEVLVGVPGSVGLVVREVTSTDVETPACRSIIETARRLHDAGRDVALSDLLLEIPDPAVQSLLVAVDEAAAARGTLDPQERVGHFTEALRRRSADRQALASARALKTNRLDSGSETEILERLLAERRAAQGMTDTGGP
ncbi:MAG: DNA primase [Planctomycetaceae bacterium]